MTKARLNYWVDIGLLITTLSTFFTGIIKFPGFLRFFGLSPRHLPMDLLMFIHDWGGLAIGILALTHLVLHWKWITTMTKNLFHKTEGRKDEKNNHLLCILLALLLLPLYAEEEISFDEVEADSATAAETAPVHGAAGRGITFSLYADVTLQADLTEKTNEAATAYVLDPSMHFGQNHLSLLGTIENEKYQAAFDFSVPGAVAEFFEFTMFTDSGSVTVGKIYIPFGSPNYHHIYGGFAGSSEFLPYSFSTYGIKARTNLTSALSLEGSISNGFAAYNDLPNTSSMAAKDDNNLLKMVSLRVGFKPTLSTEGSISVLYDAFIDENPAENSVLMYGTDWSQRAGSLLFRGGIALTEVRIKEQGLNETLLFPLTYYKLGWYAEASKKFSSFTTRLRVGRIDPDSTSFDTGDQMNANLALLVPVGALEFQGQYAYAWSLDTKDVVAPDVVTGRENHQLLLKLLIRL